MNTQNAQPMPTTMPDMIGHIEGNLANIHAMIHDMDKLLTALRGPIPAAVHDVVARPENGSVMGRLEDLVISSAGAQDRLGDRLKELLKISASMPLVAEGYNSGRS